MAGRRKGGVTREALFAQIISVLLLALRSNEQWHPWLTWMPPIGRMSG